ncbi:hypothetical protein KSP39_PZI004620 [Platanthera zijinensis]|uniref:Uncharacterized protein n=1 Tax=Platanthera zijinensis TaxID=2320716 RepID=A0AAP0GC37_9ASPA
MSRSFNCPSETRSRSAMHGRPRPFFLSVPHGPLWGKKEMDQKMRLLLRSRSAIRYDI